MGKQYTSALNSISNIFLAILFILFFGIFNGFGQSTNDNCANPISLSIGTSCSNTSFTFTSNTIETGTEDPSLCNSVTANRDGWYTFTTGPTTTSVVVSATSNRVWSLSIYSGNCSGFTQIACDNDNANTTLTLTPTVLPSTTYYVRINRTNGGTNGWNGNICVTEPPANNLCANATSLPCGTIALAGTTIGTANITSPAGCLMSNYGVWYQFVGDGEPTTITTVGLSTFDQEMSIKSGNCSVFTTLTCEDSGSSGGTETYTFTTVNLTTYYVYVSHYNSVSSTTGNFTISRTCPPNITSISATSGCVGSTFNITGTKFTGATAVTIGGTAAVAFTVNSSTSITVTVGSGTTGTVQITTPNGTATSATTFTINPVPSAVTIANANATVCKNSIQAITASGGFVPDVVAMSEDFNSASPTFTQTNNSTGGTPANATWSYGADGYVLSSATHSNDNSTFAFSDSDAQGSGGTTATLFFSPTFSLVNYSTAFLSFYQYYRVFSGATAKVQINAGSGWTNLETYTTTIGSNTDFVLKTIDISAYVGNSSVRIRFKYDASWDYYWAIDNVVVKGSKQQVTWSPITNLYTDVTCTTAYVANTHALNVWAKPTATTTYVATATAGSCSKTDDVTYTLENVTWNGSWSSAAAANKSIVFDANYTSAGGATLIEGCNCTVNSGNVIIASTDVLKLQDELNVLGGTLTFKNNASLIQINDVANTGNIIYERTAPSIKGSDYVYWSSPVINQAINNIYTSPPQGPKYAWNTTTLNGNGSQGNWESPPANMAVGRGYIIRGSSSFGMAASSINSTFTGVPNNGTIPITVAQGTITASFTPTGGVLVLETDDNQNFLGNPYPSAIDALTFLSNNSTVIEGNVQLWKHGYDPDLNNGTTYTNPFYSTYTYNYSASDYVTINNSGTSTPGYSDKIKSGQGFFVQMKEGIGATGTVNFTNTQRSNAGVPYDNDVFYRNSNAQNLSTNTVERHRIWLDIKDTNNLSEVTLVGYVEGATMGNDSFYDAFAPTLDMNIYSILNNKSLLIQGRSLPFDDNDQVSIGFNVPTTGNYNIGINTADGLFLGTQDIYLKDELLNIYHDLKTTPYSFTAIAGTHDNRFKLVYKNTALSNTTFNENAIQIVKNNSIIDIISGNEMMDNVKVYDIRGRLLVEKSKINNNTISIDVNNVQDQVLIVNIITIEGIKITRKIL